MSENVCDSADRSASLATCTGPPVELTLNTVNISKPGPEVRKTSSISCWDVTDSIAIASLFDGSGYRVDGSMVVVNSYGSCVVTAFSGTVVVLEVVVVVVVVLVLVVGMVVIMVVVASLKSDLTVACFRACSVDDCLLSPNTMTFSYGRSVPISVW